MITLLFNAHKANHWLYSRYNFLRTRLLCVATPGREQLEEASSGQDEYGQLAGERENVDDATQNNAIDQANQGDTIKNKGRGRPRIEPGKDSASTKPFITSPASASEISTDRPVLLSQTRSNVEKKPTISSMYAKRSNETNRKNLETFSYEQDSIVELSINIKNTLVQNSPNPSDMEKRLKLLFGVVQNDFTIATAEIFYVIANDFIKNNYANIASFGVIFESIQLRSISPIFEKNKFKTSALAIRGALPVKLNKPSLTPFVFQQNSLLLATSRNDHLVGLPFISNALQHWSASDIGPYGTAVKNIETWLNQELIFGPAKNLILIPVLKTAKSEAPSQYLIVDYTSALGFLPSSGKKFAFVSRELEKPAGYDNPGQPAWEPLTEEK